MVKTLIEADEFGDFSTTVSSSLKKFLSCPAHNVLPVKITTSVETRGHQQVTLFPLFSAVPFVCDMMSVRLMDKKGPETPLHHCVVEM